MKKLYTFKNSPVFLAHPVLVFVLLCFWCAFCPGCCRYEYIWMPGETHLWNEPFSVELNFKLYAVIDSDCHCDWYPQHHNRHRSTTNVRKHWPRNVTSRKACRGEQRSLAAASSSSSSSSAAAAAVSAVDANLWRKPQSMKAVSSHHDTQQKQLRCRTQIFTDIITCCLFLTNQSLYTVHTVHWVRSTSAKTKGLD